jgi:hypothetical protein
MDHTQWDGSESNASAMEEYSTYINVDGCSTAPSQYEGYDGETYLQSPLSPAMPDLGNMSDMLAINLPPPRGAESPSSEEGQDDSDDILDRLLSDVDPRDDRMYYCEDVRSEDHSCGFYHERRCMLRCVWFLFIFYASYPYSNHICVV